MTVKLKEMNWNGRFRLPGNQLFHCKAFIHSILVICCLVSGNICFAQHSLDEDIRKINALQEAIYIYDDFSSVRRMSEEIIRISKLINRMDLELEAIYLLCWSADYHKKMQEFQSYLLLGYEIINQHQDELKKTDSVGYHRASMILTGGIYYYALGNYDQAIDEFSNILMSEDRPVTLDSSILNSCYNYIGQSYFNGGHLDKSIQYFELA
ncbi:MAG: hypothetical protein EHM20_09035, partial [Alphaproteobacteria bacterium]